MQPTPYIWKNGKMHPWETCTTHVLTHGLHYGSAVFEGIRFYETDNGPAIFELEKHTRRLIYSADCLNMTIPYSFDEINDAIVETVRINEVKAGYIRPLIYYGYGNLKVVPHADFAVDMIIACWPWGNYLKTDTAHNTVDIKISPYIRIHPTSTRTDAKISGHYINSLVAGLTVRDTPYHDVLMLDSDGYVAEGSAANIFVIKDGRLFTPPLGTILPGITRSTVMTIAKQLNFPIIEKRFKPDEIYNADEAFFCGTAVEVVGIGSLEDQKIGDGHAGPITQQMQAAYQAVVHGKNPTFYPAITWINKETSVSTSTNDNHTKKPMPSVAACA